MLERIGFPLIIVAVLALVILGAIASANDRKEKQTAFYTKCLAHRERYDCDMQWETYVAALDAKASADGAMAMSAGAMAMSSSTR